MLKVLLACALGRRLPSCLRRPLAADQSQRAVVYYGSAVTIVRLMNTASHSRRRLDAQSCFVDSDMLVLCIPGTPNGLRPFSSIPGPTQYPLLGNLLGFFGDSLREPRMHLLWQQRFGRLYRCAGLQSLS